MSYENIFQTAIETLKAEGAQLSCALTRERGDGSDSMRLGGEPDRLG